MTKRVNEHMAIERIKPVSVFWWAMTLAWAALIFHLSTQTFSPDFSRGLLARTLHLLHLSLSWRTFALLDDSLRKVAHLIEYGIFALLLYRLTCEKWRGFWQPRRALICILVAAAFSLTDEFHQMFVLGRRASLLDCGFDTMGAALAMLVPYAREHISLRKSTNAFSRDECDANRLLLTK